MSGQVSRRIGAAAGISAALLLGSFPAAAHVTVQPKEAPADSYFQLAFSVPHGCDGSATVALRVKLPDGILSAKPQMKPGWNVEIETKKLATPLAGPHGGTISEVVEEVAGTLEPHRLCTTCSILPRPGATSGRTARSSKRMRTGNG